MVSKVNWAHSHKELVWVSHSCSHSYSQPHQAITSVALWCSRDPCCGSLTHYAAENHALLCWACFLLLQWVESAPWGSQSHSQPLGVWLQRQTGSVNETTLTAFLAHETGCSISSSRSDASFCGAEESSAATCKQENTPDLSLPSAKSEKLVKAKTTASVNHWLLTKLHQASLFSWLGFFFDIVWIFFHKV